jgi:hypothetical protein
MKYKDKQDSTATWTKVNMDRGYPLWAHDVNPMFVWCKQHSSTGKFYHWSHTWWFERPEDANWFVLRWS